jgi:hypothetical protein
MDTSFHQLLWLIQCTERVAINGIVDKAADATADRVAVNATIVNEAAHAVAGQVSAISDMAGGLVGA